MCSTPCIETHYDVTALLYLRQEKRKKKKRRKYIVFVANIPQRLSVRLFNVISFFDDFSRLCWLFLLSLGDVTLFLHFALLSFSLASLNFDSFPFKFVSLRKIGFFSFSRFSITISIAMYLLCTYIHTRAATLCLLSLFRPGLVCIRR